MASCDFGSPCACSDCRALNKEVHCPICNKSHKISLNGIPERKIDRKGFSYYIFKEPPVSREELICSNCN